MNGKQYADYLGIPYGTVKRWLSEGLPAERGGRSNSVRIEVTRADAWVEQHHPNSVSFNRQSVVYFVRRAKDGAIKIGWTSDVESRLRDLRKENGDSISLLAAFTGSKPDELQLHREFQRSRIEGEWFRSTPELLRLTTRHGGV